MRALINKICKYMISISKNGNVDELADILNEFNNTWHSTTKMKPVDKR